MTAAELLADLTAQGFCLDTCEDGIGVVPASRLTDAQIQAIREHKAELLDLLRAGVPPSAQVPAAKRKQRKARKRVAASKTSIQANGHGGQPPAASKDAPAPAEVTAVPSPGPIEPPAPAASPAQVAVWELHSCYRCGTLQLAPGVERCWHCGGFVHRTRWE